MLNVLKIFFITLVLSTILFFIAEKVLRKIQFGQVERKEGLESHQKKKGTPTMAGIVFIIILMIVEIFLYINRNTNTNFDFALKLNLFIILYGFVGLIDDLLKVLCKNSKGLSSILKFLFQVLIAYFGIKICFSEITSNDLWMTLVYIFIIVGTDNGVNFTDGVDGLCGFVTLIIAIFYSYLCYVQLPQIQNGDILFLNKYFALLVINIIMLSMLIAFLFFNHYPAKIFMGDAGSLFLGGYVAFMAIALNVHFYLPMFGIIYMLEVLSVILQVSYFKITKGKRIFKMAPIHHHFEKSGFTEWQVVIVFSMITFLGCILTILIR